MNFYDTPNAQTACDVTYAHKVQEIPREPKFYPNELPFTRCNILMPPVKPAKKKSKIDRVYEDDNWIIDLIDGNVRVSYFEGGHFVDEMIVSKESFK